MLFHRIKNMRNSLIFFMLFPSPVFHFSHLKMGNICGRSTRTSIAETTAATIAKTARRRFVGENGQAPLFLFVFAVFLSYLLIFSQPEGHRFKSHLRNQIKPCYHRDGKAFSFVCHLSGSDGNSRF